LGLEWSTLFPNSPARPVRRSQPETERAQREALLVEADPTLPVIRISAGTGKRAQMRFPESRLAAWLKGREQGLGRPQPKKPKPSVAEVSEITAAKSGAKAPWANGWAKRPAKGH